MENLLGYEAFDKRNGATGKIVHQDSLTITIQVADVVKSYTHNTFNKWWAVIPQDELPEEQQEVFIPTHEIEYDSQGLPIGQAGIGIHLRDKFIGLINELDIDEIVIFYNPREKIDVVKYNGYNIFEVYQANKRLNVMAHPNSLTPMNKNKVVQMFPKEHQWSLRAKFIFTNLNQWPLMKSIINDGLFYRRLKDDDK